MHAYILHYSGVNGYTVAGRYTPSERDRAGLTLSCTDTEHANWKEGNTEQTATITPQCEYHIDLSLLVHLYEN